MNRKCKNPTDFEHFRVLCTRKAQLDVKGMAIKYVVSIFLVLVAVGVLSKVGIIGQITPGGGLIEDDGGNMITGAVVTDTEDEVHEVNDTATENNGTATEQS